METQQNTSYIFILILTKVGVLKLAIQHLNLGAKLCLGYLCLWWDSSVFSLTLMTGFSQISNHSLNNKCFVWCIYMMVMLEPSESWEVFSPACDCGSTCWNKLPLTWVLLCTKMSSFKLAPIFQFPVRTVTACFTHSLYKLPPFQVKVPISVLPALPGVAQEHFGWANMADSKCVCSASCCKIIISSRTVLNYKHMLTVWSVNVNWGKRRRS